ncbi:thiamine pyrophosphate-dependent dehydrogenase E1 component subunit alpha [Rhodococcus rhodochrous]|uniref:thiamine pyrophosphate-dependent dehydrogenase E1 component subunit alpha n=1 Tax=Rhodococcus rhodochrous TaxID=1829 RepID=UPI000A640E7C|nr:thiamine pyrophosphate-dependent dehydrogenase E1 component subunit alpha [Rhodococcus rhodochrous]
MHEPYRFAPAEGDIEPLSMLDIDGALHPGAVAMKDDAALDALELMILTRTFDEKATSLQRQGRFGTFSAVRGQEASVVGAASALDPSRDWVVPQYRELPALLRQGLPLENFALYFMGHPLGGVIPDQVNILPIQISLAAQLPQAVGLAWGLQHQGQDAVVTVFIGDGASSEGDFHEALNLAGVRKAPVIFFLQNNGWAISTPRRAQSAARTLAERGPGYGVDGIIVDGNDLFAVDAAMTEAVRKARAGEGPTLIESLTWRAGAHNTADDPSRYVTAEDEAPWAGTDPIERVEKYLTSRGIWTEELATEVRQRCATEVDRALKVARATPPAGPAALFDHVYASPPARTVAQRTHWLATYEDRHA